MNTPSQSVEVGSKTVVSTAKAYGLIGAMAVFAFTNIWGSLFDYKKELDQTTIATAQATTTPDVHQLTLKLFSPGTLDKAKVVAQRKTALLKLAETNPVKAQAALLAGPVLDQLPADIRSQLEQEVTLEGTLQVMHYDIDVAKNQSTHELYLEQGDKRIRVHTPNVLAFESLANTKVKLHAYQLDIVNLLMSPSDTGIDGVSGGTPPPPPPPPSPTLVTRKVAVIMFNFQNDTRQGTTASNARNLVFGSSNSANAYDREVSFGTLGLIGKTDITGDVTGFYTIPYNNAYNLPLDPTTDCKTNYNTWTTAARTAATNAGFDLTGYDHYVYMFQAPFCSGTGWAELNGDETWITNYNYTLVTHEHGHNLGAMHASSYSCVDAAGQPINISTNCVIGEYGDPFDVMGSPFRHFNNAHKNETKFLPAANIQDVTTDGDYTLVPIEQSSTGIQALRLSRNLNGSGQVSEQYWLEYRRPYGIDSFSSSDPVVNGVSIRLARNPGISGYISTNTLLLDSTPQTSTFSDAPLVVGQTFDDTYYGLRFETLEATADHATVRVSHIAAACVRGTPTFTLTPPASIYASAGQGLNYSLATTNTDSPACAPAQFNIVPTLPANWTQKPSPVIFTLNPGQVNYTTITVTSPVTEVAGKFEFTEVATNTASKLSATANGAYISTGPDTQAPVVTISSPVNNSTLKGKTFKVQAAASDAGGIARMEILIDNVLMQTCTATTSCTYNGQVASLTTGSHTILVKATDASVNANIGTASITVLK